MDKKVQEYLEKDFLQDVKKFMAINGSKFHNGIEDEEALKAFIQWKNEKNK